jgi:ribosomal protein S27E
MAPGYRKDAYRDAIEKVRSEHSGSIKPANMTIECPRCGTRQVVTDAPGKRVCLKCGFEFGRLTRG